MKRPGIFLGLLVLLSIFSGLAEPGTAKEGEFMSVVGLVHAFVGASLLFFWCKAHAASRGIEAPTGSAQLIFLFALVGVPVYFFRTMPWRDAVIANLKALAFSLMCMTLYSAAFRLSQHFVS
jgi:hypothetical protein